MFAVDIVNHFYELTKKYNIPHNLVKLEITESAYIDNAVKIKEIVVKLKSMGFTVLMDDFGIGFSNVGNLRKIPFDVVKIDKSFIDGIVNDTKSREIVRFLIGLCKINGMEVVAEGVDNKEQVEILKKAKCDTIQGFYYSEALEKKAFEKFLDNNQFEKKEGSNA
jgi:EAL domain-containing protein (putative c-di-GMP-specific phosphodiesterase class I)